MKIYVYIFLIPGQSLIFSNRNRDNKYGKYPIHYTLRSIHHKPIINSLPAIFLLLTIPMQYSLSDSAYFVFGVDF